MEEFKNFYTEEYRYDAEKNESHLFIEYNFSKVLNKERKKEFIKRLNNFEQILDFISERGLNRDKLIYTQEPNFIEKIRSRFKIYIKAQKRVDKKDLFDANRLEKYLLWGK